MRIPKCSIKGVKNRIKFNVTRPLFTIYLLYQTTACYSTYCQMISIQPTGQLKIKKARRLKPTRIKHIAPLSPNKNSQPKKCMKDRASVFLHNKNTHTLWVLFVFVWHKQYIILRNVCQDTVIRNYLTLNTEEIALYSLKYIPFFILFGETAWLSYLENILMASLMGSHLVSSLASSSDFVSFLSVFPTRSQMK